ncbi:hypothetical protein AURDEDRAFT_171117 [Auricularia subglabra TFB-10046 SS5]|nr:hypothetical protein AURDEDRAFT_171117 [Auricularia subglabra TFB-10046 SS5]
MTARSLVQEFVRSDFDFHALHAERRVVSSTRHGIRFDQLDDAGVRRSGT